ncbi:MAG: hypothetical protein ACHQRM_17695 [Bacteroidia bacterium]
MRKKVTLLYALSLVSLHAFAQESYGFQYIYYCNQWQYDQMGFFAAGPNMVFGGSSNSQNVIMATDTNGTFLGGWTISDPGYLNLARIRKQTVNTTVLSGMYNNFPQSAYIATMNHVTGAAGTGYTYNHSSLPFPNGNGIAYDGIALANGDMAMTGAMNENTNNGLGVTNLGIGACGGATQNGYGYLIGNFGSTWYMRGNDVFLIRTGADGDTNNYTKGNLNHTGFVKKYSLAYCGPGYAPAQPTSPARATGNFCYQFNSAWIGDSTRHDEGRVVIEVGTDLFIVGRTQDYNSSYQFWPLNQYDYEAFVLKLNAAGAVQWCRTFFLGSQTTCQEFGMGIAAVTSDGSNDVILTINSQQSYNIELARLTNGTGSIVWANSYKLQYDTGVDTTTRYSRPWGIKESLLNPHHFVVGGIVSNGYLGSYDMVLLEIDRNGAMINTTCYGTANMDGTDSQNLNAAEVDQVNSKGTYALSGVTAYSGGSNVGAYVIKVNNLYNNAGCTSSKYTPLVTVYPRSGANQLHSRIPVVYETRGGATVNTLSLTSTSITGGVTSSEICVLPVELLSFTAQPVGKTVLTKWSTASETNNNYFTVERSKDAQHFEEVGRVNGAGNSSITLNYEFTDEKPLSGISYYRLKQTDFNGKFTYSEIATVDFAGTNEMNVFYNHETNNCTLAFNFQNAGNYKLKIINSLGQEVLNDELIGVNSGPFEKNYSLSGLAKNMYIVYLISQEHTYVKKINAY